MSEKVQEGVREAELAGELGIEVDELRRWRQKATKAGVLVVDEHFWKSPIRYTPEGRKRVLEHFRAFRRHSEEEDLTSLIELAEECASTQTVRPIVEKIPPNQRLVLCQVGEHHNVRVMVRPNHFNYILKMEIPMDVSLINFNPNELLIFNGDPPRRKGQW